MKKLTATATVALIFFLAGLAGLIWLLCGGAADGAGWLTGVGFGVSGLTAIGSKVLGGGWFTDNANGH